MSLVPAAVRRYMRDCERRRLRPEPSIGAGLLTVQLGSVENALEWLRESHLVDSFPYWREVRAVLRQAAEVTIE